MKRNVSIIFFITVAVCLYFLLDLGRFFLQFKPVVQSQHVSGKILEKGTLGKVLKQLNLVRPVPDHERNRPLSAEHLGKKKGYLYLANPKGDLHFPSTQKIIENNIQSDYPILSIVVDDSDLYGEERGIITNPFHKGALWERIAYVSYFEKHRLLFASSAGIRIHGHVSRKDPKKSYRLYFRNELSGSGFPGYLFNDRQTIPLKRMVVHLDRPLEMPFTTSMAFDIARRIGCILPRIKPLILYLNGERQGVYWIADQINKKQWSNHIGNDNFFLYRSMADNDIHSRNQFFLLAKKISGLGEKPSLQAVKELVDINNLSRYMFAIIFCGDDDWEKQGVSIFDNNQPDAKWHWVIWDMDHSFADHLSGWDKREIWEKPGLKLVFKDKLHPFDVKQNLFQRLIQTSPEYREYFVRLSLDICNHLLTQRFLEERSDYYMKLAQDLKTDHPFNEKMRDFLMNRSTFILKDLKRYLQLGEIVNLRLKGDVDSVYQVDGFPVKNDYHGRYYTGITSQISVVQEGLNKFSYWLVNGERLDDEVLTLHLKGDTTVEAVFQ